MAKERDDLLDVIAFGEQKDLFGSPEGEALKGLWERDLLDPATEELLRGIVRPDQRKEERGQGTPFHIPRLSEKEGILFGQDVSSEKKDIRISKKFLGSHGILVSGTGGGKTTLVMPIALQVMTSGSKAWVIQSFKNEYSCLMPILQREGHPLTILRPHQWKCNLLQPSAGVDPRTHLALVENLLSKSLHLTTRGRSLLKQVCHRLYGKYAILEGGGQRTGYPTLYEVIEEVRCSKANYAVKEGLLDPLISLALALGPSSAAFHKGHDALDFIEHNIVFENSSQGFAGKILIENALYSVMYSKVASGLRISDHREHPFRFNVNSHFARS